MSIYDMIPGNVYLSGDSYGYDYVRCVKIHPANTCKEMDGVNYPVVEVEYVDTGVRDFWFESPEYMGSTYVEPYIVKNTTSN